MASVVFCVKAFPLNSLKKFMGLIFLKRGARMVLGLIMGPFLLGIPGNPSNLNFRHLRFHTIQVGNVVEIVQVL